MEHGKLCGHPSESPVSLWQMWYYERFFLSGWGGGGGIVFHFEIGFRCWDLSPMTSGWRFKHFRIVYSRELVKRGITWILFCYVKLKG